jgi:signal peptidase II
LRSVEPLRKSIRSVLLIAATIGCDQVTKIVAQNTLRSRPPISLFGDHFKFLYVENAGAFLGLGGGLSETTRFWLFTVMVGGFLIGLFFYLLFNRRSTLPDGVAFSLILGGGFSNLIDRFLHDHRVIDFMLIGIGPVRTGVFNVADVAITSGVGLLFWLSIRSPHRSTL